MDRTQDCGSCNAGSNPTEGTKKNYCGSLTTCFPDSVEQGKDKAKPADSNTKRNRIMSAKHRGLERFTPPEKEEQLKQELVAKEIVAKIQKAVASIKKLQNRYPEKSLLQLLVRIRLEEGNFATLAAIARIKRNQWDKLSEEDKMFVEQQKQLVLQNASPSEKLLSETFQL